MNASFEEPQPWTVPMVSVSLGGAPARTCRVTRQPDGTLRLALTGHAVPGLDVYLQWTQNGSGCTIMGTVVTPAPGSLPGIHVRTDGSLAGIQRRAAPRIDVRVPAVVTLSSGHLFPGPTVDLSTGGAHVVVDLVDMGEEQVVLLAEDLARGAIAVVEVLLPDGPAELLCEVRGGGDEPGDVRLLFAIINDETQARLSAFLDNVELTAAAS